MISGLEQLGTSRRLSIAAAIATILLAACTVLSTPGERRSHADLLTAARDWRAEVIAAGSFDLVAYAPAQIKPGNVLTVYIEGDGLAWLSSSTPSADPTPRDPLALRLALIQPQGNAAYLARPCQYVDAAASGCNVKYWTSHRFAPEVVEASDVAVEQLKQKFSAKAIELVGYSGGGAIATLIAARRKDVVRLVTVAGNLDHEAWTRLHRDAPLTGSLNPARHWPTLVSVPQMHFSGGSDRNVSFEVAKSFQARFPESQQPRLQLVDGFDHTCCWAEKWPDLYRRAQLDSRLPD